MVHWRQAGRTYDGEAGGTTPLVPGAEAGDMLTECGHAYDLCNVLQRCTAVVISTGETYHRHVQPFEVSTKLVWRELFILGNLEIEETRWGWWNGPNMLHLLKWMLVYE